MPFPDKEGTGGRRRRNIVTVDQRDDETPEDDHPIETRDPLVVDQAVDVDRPALSHRPALASRVSDPTTDIGLNISTGTRQRVRQFC